jgi:predicted transcriptional regulator
MKIKNEFRKIIQEIQNDDKEFSISTRELLSYFDYEKRSKGNNVRIDKYLDEHNLETEPDFKNAWIDGQIILKHKAKAKSKSAANPIQRLSILPAANKSPVTINRDATLSHAITLMMMNNYSQLPVMSNPRSVAGLISWETIGYGITNGNKSNDVKDFLKTDVEILDLDTPLLDAIKTVIKDEIVLVQNKDKTLAGIVTIADISSQFLILTEPFLLLEKIENLIRLLLDDKFLVEDLSEFCAKENIDYQLEYIDDLTFGQYIRLIENPENWEKLNLKIERQPFIKQLDIIREIRNDIMHFDSEGISQEQRQTLHNMAKFLSELIKYI